MNNEENIGDSEKSEDDFVKDLQKQIMQDIPFTNSFWAEDIAISLLSAVSGNLQFYTRVGRVPVNTWFMAIAQSSRGYKSPPLNYFLRPIIKKIEQKSGNLKWKILLPSSFSMEGMTEFLAKTSNRGIIVNDEISALFKATQGKGYTISLMEFLDRLFDGIVEPRYTRQYKLDELPDGAYVSLIGATTPTIYHVLDYDTFTSGFGMRFLYELWDPSQEIYYDVLQLFGSDSGARESILEKYAVPLSKIYSKDIIKTRVDDVVMVEFAKYRQELEDRASEEERRHNQNLANYIEKVSIYLFKLAPLFALSRNISSVANSQKEAVVDISVQDVERAYNKINRHIDNFKQILSNWNIYKNSKAVPISDYTPTYEAMVAFVREAGGAITTRSLAIKMGWLDANSSSGITEKYSEIIRSSIELHYLKKLSPEEIRSLPKETLEKLGISLIDKNGNPVKKLPYVVALPEFSVEALNNKIEEVK